MNSPDYIGVDKDFALQDFLKRIEHYAARYEPIDDDIDKDLPYIKIFNQGQRYLANRIAGESIYLVLSFFEMSDLLIKVATQTVYGCLKYLILFR